MPKPTSYESLEGRRNLVGLPGGGGLGTMGKVLSPENMRRPFRDKER